ncbi:unnamed protein product [Closterium sp. NIES-53]
MREILSPRTQLRYPSTAGNRGSGQVIDVVDQGTHRRLVFHFPPPAVDSSPPAVDSSPPTVDSSPPRD